MFIIKKKVAGKDYYYLRKSERRDGKVKSVCVAYLGKDKADAEKKAAEIMSGKEKIEQQPKASCKVVPKEISIEDMAGFCKRKGFVYPSAEIYGGLAGFWDFGPLGSEMKNNLKQAWWKYHVHGREDIVGIDGSIITNPMVWKASGHEASFSDVLVLCKKCKKAGKVDKHEVGNEKIKCVNCQGDYDWKSVKEIEQMFKTKVGLDGSAYLRPETAQLIFTNFKLVQEGARMKLPFGIAQVGKAFRNEIAPRDFIFRNREFEQMEIEYFVNPNEKCPYKIGNTKVLIYSEDMQKKNKEPEKIKFKDAFEKGIIKTEWHAYWLEQELLWFASLGANIDKFRIRQHVSDEKSHYALDTWDLEYNFPFGWMELQGMANRTDFDLKQHQEHSKKNLEIVDEKGGKLLPHVVCEPSQGVERAFLVFMFDSYHYDETRNNVILKLHPKLAPIKAAIFPIIKKPEYEKISQEIFEDLSNEFNVIQDKSGSIGRRYSRNDESGTPMCITVDDQTPKDKMVTIRDRDTTKQVRVKIEEIKDIVRKVVSGESLLDLAKEVKTRVK
jgi:glycyl-tRNA synthetase